ncbi:MAG: transcriptional regulator OruR [Holophagaceae bacterium]|nr:transcriptional regulator OruR [Holophagaceae bacterium]
MTTPNTQVERGVILQQQFAVIEHVLREEGQMGCFERLLERVGLSPEALQGDLSGLSRAKYTSLLYHLNEEKKIPDLGVKLGTRKGPKAYGVIGVGMVTGLSFALALKLATWMVQIVWGPFATLTIERGRDGDFEWLSGRLHVAPSLPPEMAANIMDEAMVSGARLTLESLPGVDPSLMEVRLNHPAPPHADLFRRLCPCPCRFDQPFSEVRHPVEWLEMPAPFANEAVARYCEQLCQTLAQPSPEGGRLATLLRECLMEMDLAESPRMESAADRMEMTPRALRAGLAKEGSSFRDVLVATRIELAQRYLASTNYTAKEIAYRLGFGYLPNFYRLFSHCTGLTPEQFRLKSSKGL